MQTQPTSPKLDKCNISGVYLERKFRCLLSEEYLQVTQKKKHPNTILAPRLSENLTTGK